jgi:hypothetical protein
MASGNVRDWLADTRERMAGDVLGGLQLGAYYLYVGLWLTLSTRMQFGTPAYEREWDLLVVLDTCRTDALAAVADEYDFLDDREAIWSPGSTSGEWVAHTFDRAYTSAIGRTAYVTANPHSDEVLRNRLMPPQYVAVPATWPDWNPVQPEAFGLLDEVWVDGRNEDWGVVPPATLTDRDPLTQPCAEPFEALRRGEASRDRIWAHYLDNLRLVLDEVAVLLENVDADRVAITADHGEAFGEWGFYEHPVGCPLPAVKRVPWAETTATDHRTREAAVAPADTAERNVTEQLRDLGYR